MPSKAVKMLLLVWSLFQLVLGKYATTWSNPISWLGGHNHIFPPLPTPLNTQFLLTDSTTQICTPHFSLSPSTSDSNRLTRICNQLQYSLCPQAFLSVVVVCLCVTYRPHFFPVVSYEALNTRQCLVFCLLSMNFNSVQDYIHCSISSQISTLTKKN